MIKLKAMRNALSQIDPDKYLYFLDYDEYKCSFMLECVYNNDDTQISHRVRFKDYSSYTAQFLQIKEKMDKLVKVLNQTAE